MKKKGQPGHKGKPDSPRPVGPPAPPKVVPSKDAALVASWFLRPGSLLTAAMALHEDRLNDMALSLGRLAAVLPVGTLKGSDRSIYGRKRFEGLQGYVVATANALRCCPLLAAAVETPADQLISLLTRDRAYEALRLWGDLLKNRGLDLRLVYRVFLFHAIKTLLAELKKHIEDQGRTQHERDLLIGDFGPALMLLDEWTRQRSKRREHLKELGEQAAANAAEARAEAELAQVTLALRHHLPVDDGALRRAAQRYAAKHG